MGQNKEPRAEKEAKGNGTKPARNTRKQIFIKEGASQLRKANEKTRLAPNLVFLSSHQRGAKCCHWAWAGAPEARGRLSGDSGACTAPTHYYVRVSRAASFAGIGLLHRHRAFLGEMSFTSVGLLHRHWAFLGSSSFTGTGPSL